ncbi:uncharacterized protein [Oscarella lobularis]|uniref:uncharacterized protein n=1 Tax=Oscarella lobularis TaxID=121494 RepID=UPI003313643E
MIIIIFALVLAAGLKKKKKRNAIQRCFIWDYYVSFTLSSKSSARQLSSNCQSFFKDVLRPALTKTGSSYYNLHAPSDSRSGPRLGDDPMVASHQAIEKSWKMVVVIDEEEDEAGFEEQRAEVADYQTDIAALEDEKEKIHPSFVIIRLGSRLTATDVGVDDPRSAIVLKEESMSDFKKRSELRSALKEAKQNSEFIWDVALFYIDSDSDFAHKVQDVIQTWLGCLVQSFCHRNPDTCHLSTRHVAAYSRSVVAIISDDYVEHAWEQDRWIVQLERKAYLPIIESHRLTCPLPAEIIR